MQLCPNCTSKQFDGTIFCTECGASLLTTNRRETTVSLGQQGASDAVPEAVLPQPPATAEEEPRITLVVMNSGRRINLNVGDDLLLGRKDNARGIFPDVDLGLDGGYDSGVSRRHAILARKGDRYILEDLGSANGTFINGRQLAPSQPTRLASGDEIRCGTLLLRIEFDER
ncbi:forkhead-associated protein [Kouleothrix aurantiaca]|jgi:hypothetical protein|uniref:Forkhead-associated protein n=1 Tax=Kouleothrix aurantiaca TaxID=186479 RepID=A0A0P9F5J1_9CHLR|nr:forkhead-associated protein [Kouleothrix aurantiaca]